MNDIAVLDKEGLEALPVDTIVKKAGIGTGSIARFVRTEHGFADVGRTGRSPEYTSNYLATHFLPAIVQNPQEIGPFVAVGDKVQIVQRFYDGTSSRYDGQVGRLVRFNQGWGQPYEVEVPKLGGGTRVVSAKKVDEVRPDPLEESLAELLPFYVGDPKVLDELPMGSVIIPLEPGNFPKVKLDGDSGEWYNPDERGSVTQKAKEQVASTGAMVVSLGTEGFLRKPLDFN